MARLGRPRGSKNKPKVEGPKPPPRRAWPGAGRPRSKGFLREVGALGSGGDESIEPSAESLEPCDESLEPCDESLERLKQIRSPNKPLRSNWLPPPERPAAHGLPGVRRPAGQTDPGTVQGMPRPAQRELVARIAASGLTPLEYFLAILRDPKQPKIRRDWAAERCAPYCHSRLASMVHTGKGGGPIQTFDLSKISDEQLAVLESIFGAIVQSGGHPGGAEEGADST